MLLTIFISIRRLALSHQVRIIQHAEESLVRNSLHTYDIIYFAGPVQIEENKLFILKNFMTSKGNANSFSFESFGSCVEKLGDFLSEAECKKILESPIIIGTQKGQKERREKIAAERIFPAEASALVSVQPYTPIKPESARRRSYRKIEKDPQLEQKGIDELEQRHHATVDFLQKCYERHQRPEHLWFASTTDNDIFNTFCILGMKHNRNIIRLVHVGTACISTEILIATVATHLSFEEVVDWLKQIAVHNEPAIINNLNYIIVAPDFEAKLKQNFMMLQEVIDAFLGQMAAKIKHEWQQPIRGEVHEQHNTELIEPLSSFAKISASMARLETLQKDIISDADPLGNSYERHKGDS